MSDSVGGAVLTKWQQQYTYRPVNISVTFMYVYTMYFNEICEEILFHSDQLDCFKASF